MSKKIFCRVPGCHRYTRRETALKRWGSVHVSLICGFHWRRLTKAERAVWARLRRQEHRYGQQPARQNRVWDALIRRSALP